jgi:hypothetical protein
MEGQRVSTIFGLIGFEQEHAPTLQVFVIVEALAPA